MKRQKPALRSARKAGAAENRHAFFGKRWGTDTMRHATQAGLGFLLIGAITILFGLWKMYSGAHGSASTIIASGLAIELAGMLLLRVAQSLAGYVILIGLLVVAAGVWRYFYGSHTSADTIMLAGAVLAHAGAILAGRAHLPAEPLKGPAVSHAPHPAIHYEGVRDVREDAYFTVIENFEDTALDDIAILLRRDPRIREVYHDSGRYHSTPDGDDLPEWFALRVACKRDVLESAMKDAGEAILRELGPDVAKRVSIRHYS
jgi:hypothetical protein